MSELCVVISSLVHTHLMGRIFRPKNEKNSASIEIRSWVFGLEGRNANHYTTDSGNTAGDY